MTIVAEEDKQLSGFSPEIRLSPAAALARPRIGRPISRLQPSIHRTPLYLPARPNVVDLRQSAFTRRLPCPERSGLHFGESVALGLLTVGAVLSVGYGLLCGIGLASHWDLFQSGIQRLLQ